VDPVVGHIPRGFHAESPYAGSGASPIINHQDRGMTAMQHRSIRPPQLPSRPSITPGRSPALSRTPRLRAAPIHEEMEPKDDRKRRSTKAPATGEAPSCKAGKSKVGNWQALRERLASCWTVPPRTEGSSVTLRFGISSVGELRGPPLVSATNVTPKELAAAYRNAATSVLEQCLPICPTEDFGALLHENTLHLRLVNDAPFPSRNLGPWMTIFSRSRR